MRRRIHSASALVIVLAITLLLASQIYILHVFSGGSFRHIDRVNAHVRAIYVGESAFSRVLARLKGASWAERWFREAAAVENDVPLGEGSYSSYVSSVSDPARS